MPTALRKPFALAALGLLTLTLVACGESAEDKAKAQVCNARANISKEITKLSELPLSTNLPSEIKSGAEAIGKNLTTIKDEQDKLAPARKEQVQTASSTFANQVSSIVSGLLSTKSLSLTNAEAQLKSAATQLKNSYKAALAPINCS
jgi:hypothetical protein